MEFTYHRVYRGPVRAVIFDWAGTTVDYGCMAPAAVFIQLFSSRNVTITMEQAREPMGMHKRDHIRAIMHMEAVARQWEAEHGARPTEKDVDELFSEFVPALTKAITHHSDIIPGVVETVGELRNRHLCIGSTTGYNMEIMQSVQETAERSGYKPDSLVCADQVPAARPAPWMALKSAMQMGVYPLESIVKVGDTPADIGEGLNAGMWSVGVVRHGNEVGLSESDLVALPLAERERRFTQAQQRLAKAGAHCIIDTITDLPAMIDAINTRLARGERP